MTHSWWKESVIYQIYPRSFNDSNGDGIGDLQGIIQKLDYLKKLGVDVLWLSPIYQSPNDDNGYDISDYYNIMDEFGTMDDFDQLLEEVHARGLKLVMDLVVNHSSDEHFWFQEARKSKDNPYRDFYYWESEIPNNWQSFFNGPAWEKDELTGEYYLHLFTKKQPDLNWENPKLRQEVYKMMRFWLDKGIDGFRMDVIPLISKRLEWPDADFSNFAKVVEEVYANGPRLHEFLQEMHREVLSHYDILTVGEAPGVTPSNVNLYVGEDRKELNMIHHFGHMFLDWGVDKYDYVGWDLNAFKNVFVTWHKALGETGWISPFLDNHDFSRMVSRWGNDGEYRIKSAKLLATLLLTLRGTPSVYMGSEIGMTNVAFDSIDDYDDVETRNAYQAYLEAGKDMDKFMQAVHRQSRDNVRTPIQWDDTENAGFTSGTPWLKVNPNYPAINAEAVLADSDSIFYYYQEMLALRKAHKTLVYGDFELVDGSSEQLFAYRRWDADGEFWVYLNFSEEMLSDWPQPEGKAMELVIGNYADAVEQEGILRAWEARVYRLP